MEMIVNENHRHACNIKSSIMCVLAGPQEHEYNTRTAYRRYTQTHIHTEEQ